MKIKTNKFTISLKFKTLILIYLLSFSLSKAQNLKNDTLSKYNYEELRIKIVQNLNKEPFVKTYSDYYLKKALNESNQDHIIKGYEFKIDVSSEKDAIEYAKLMLVYIQSNKPSLVFKYFLKLGDIYYRTRQNSKSLKYYLLAYKKCNKKDLKGVNEIKMQIAALKCLLCMYDDSIIILNELKDYCTIENPNLKLYFYSLQAENYLGKNNLQKSKLFINSGLELSKNLKEESLVKIFKLLESIYHFKNKEFQKSLQYLLKSINYTTTKNDFTVYSMTSYYIGKNYEKLHLNEKAILYFKKVDSIFSKKNDIYPDNIDAYEFLISYYKKKGDINKELYYSKQLIKADKVFYSNNNDLEGFVHKNYEIPKLLDNQREVERKMKLKQTILLTIVIIISIVFLIVLYVYSYRKKRMKQKISILQNDLDTFLNIQQKLYEQKSKNQIETKNLTSIKSKEELIPNNEKKKLPDEKKEQIKKGLDLFESSNGFLINECSLEFLAKKINTNKTYLSQYLNDDLGFTYTNYINNLRINYFVYLLKTEKKIKFYSIESISELLGYKSVKVFSNAFKEKMGILPSIFIKKFETQNIENQNK
ncbi:helix-turn-helix domain-containing protein [Flavobacterium terrae]|nr:helix-turn-helix domain-containing protein [Flavobacterium terrae]